MEAFYPMAICFKHKDKVSFRGNYLLNDFKNYYIYITACDSNKRSTCKPRSDSVEFVRKSNFYLLF